MKILGIDTSCDETSIAVVQKREEFKILSNVVSSQVKIHREYGGVYPTLARREHEKNLTPVLGESLKKADLLQSGNSFVESEVLENSILKEKLTKFLKNYQAPALDLVAVTVGPGLDPCLWTGINFAKTLSYCWNIPVVPINHIEAHILSNYFTNELQLPALALIVSGGHTQLILVKDVSDYEIIGETRDDAAGECFDKTARLLQLGFPGGPAIAEKAIRSDLKIKLPRPMLHSKNYDFSFSGLKTAVLYEVRDQQLTDKYVSDMAYEIQEAIIDVLVKKTLRAAQDFKVDSIILGGGVTANQRLREKMKSSNFKILIPDQKLCTDNGAMIAVTAYFHCKETKPWQKLKSQPNLRL